MNESNESNELSSAVVHGRVFNTVLFQDESKANAFMESNEDYGVLLVDDTGIHLAKLTDKGNEVTR